jgi:hypothetical protein
MTRDAGLGGGSGQFSAWLNQRSDVAGEQDEDTVRNIPTYFFELPVKADNYTVPYQNTVGDGSNDFHPSSDIMRLLWEDAVNPMFLSLIRHTRSPFCPNQSGLKKVDHCAMNDFGLVGAKIAEATDLPGLLDYNARLRSETLSQGNRRVVFAVQNFSSEEQTSPPGQTGAHVLISRNGATPADYPVTVTLAPGDRDTFSVEHNFAPGDYRVEINLDADDYLRNNSKVFAFTVPQMYAVRRAVHLGSGSQQMNAQGSFSYSARFEAGQQVDPSAADLRITIYSRRSGIPNTQTQSSSLSFVLPKGSRWWSKSVPSQGLWTYSDPKRTNSPVTSLTIKQLKGSKLNKKSQVTVDLTAGGDSLKILQGAQSYTVDMDFTGANLRLSSVALGTKPQEFSRKLLPINEGEEEPKSSPINQNQ